MADYRIELPNADPLMVRANNRAQAIRYATHKLVKVEILTTEEAIRLAKAGQELLDATGEPDSEPEPQLLPEPEKEPEGNGSTDPAEPDATTQDAAQSDASGQSGTSGTKGGANKPPSKEKTDE